MSIPNPRKSEDPRTDRLKAALKANIARRKAQARARAQGDDGADADDPHTEQRTETQ
jgi:hypothetical protein